MTLEQLKKRKAQLGYSNEKIAQLSGVPVSTVRKIFSGITKQPRYETILALDVALSPSYTLNETALAYMTKAQGQYTIDDYNALPEEARVELIDGVLYDMSSPAIDHQTIASSIFLQLKLHTRKNKGPCIVIIAPCDVHLSKEDNKTIVQPDLFILCDKNKIVNGRIEGAPDFVLEVLSPSTRRKDMAIKFNKYIESGVREYWIIDQENKKVIVYLFEDDINTFMYTFNDKIPVAVWNNEYHVDMREVQNELDFINEPINKI